MLGLPAELQQQIVSRLSWTAAKALARASRAARDAARRGVASLEWHDRAAPLLLTDLRLAFPSARCLVLRAFGGGPTHAPALLGAHTALPPHPPPPHPDPSTQHYPPNDLTS